MQRIIHRFSLAFLMVGTGLALTMGMAQPAENGAVRSLIRDNALLRTIGERDPPVAVAFATEIQDSLAAARRGETSEDEPRFIFRGGGVPSGDGPRDSEIMIRNRKDFDENPALREIYSRSPLASLRMLKRLRDAAGRN